MPDEQTNICEEIATGDSGLARNPFAAYSLAQFIPGAGHLYAGDNRRGLFFLVPWLLCSVAVIAIHFQWPIRMLAPNSELILFKVTVGLLFCGWIFWVGSLINVSLAAHQSKIGRMAGPFSFCYSFFFPGWGQAASEKFLRAAAFALLFSTGAASILVALFAANNWHKLTGVATRELLEMLMVPAFVLGPLAPVTWLVSLIDQRRQCRKVIGDKELTPALLKQVISGTLTLQVVLVGLLIVLAAVVFLPREPIIDRLENGRKAMINSGFLILPGLIEKLQDQIARHPAIYEDQLIAENNGKFVPPQAIPHYPPPLYGTPPSEPTAPEPTAPEPATSPAFTPRQVPGQSRALEKPPTRRNVPSGLGI